MLGGEHEFVHTTKLLSECILISRIYESVFRKACKVSKKGLDIFRFRVQTFLLVSSMALKGLFLYNN